MLFLFVKTTMLFVVATPPMKNGALLGEMKSDLSDNDKARKSNDSQVKRRSWLFGFFVVKRIVPRAMSMAINQKRVQRM